MWGYRDDWGKHGGGGWNNTGKWNHGWQTWTDKSENYGWQTRNDTENLGGQTWNDTKDNAQPENGTPIMKPIVCNNTNVKMKDEWYAKGWSRNCEECIKKRDGAAKCNCWKCRKARVVARAAGVENTTKAPTTPNDGVKKVKKTTLKKKTVATVKKMLGLPMFMSPTQKKAIAKHNNDRGQVLLNLANLRKTTANRQVAKANGAINHAAIMRARAEKIREKIIRAADMKEIRANRKLEHAKLELKLAIHITVYGTM